MSDQVLGEDAAKPDDRRVLRTRSAIRSAFNTLILSRGYDAISAADVAEAANVGRSTFYEHYQGKEDVLAQSLVTVLEPLANACLAQTPEPPLATVVEHFWDNRQLAKALMAGRARTVMARRLAGLIEQRLENARPAGRSGRPVIPLSLLAVQMAHGQLALLEEWLSGRYGCTAAQIASALQATSRAFVADEPPLSDLDGALTRPA
jgi:AcrR family transcriptional regulator